MPSSSSFLYPDKRHARRNWYLQEEREEGQRSGRNFRRDVKAFNDEKKRKANKQTSAGGHFCCQNLIGEAGDRQPCIEGFYERSPLLYGRDIISFRPVAQIQALKVWSPLVISFSDFPDGRAAFWLSNPLRPRQCNEVKAMFTTATVLPFPTAFPLLMNFHDLLAPWPLPFFLSSSLKSRWTFFRPRWIPGGMASSSKLDSIKPPWKL